MLCRCREGNVLWVVSEVENLQVQPELQGEEDEQQSESDWVWFDAGSGDEGLNVRSIRCVVADQRGRRNWWKIIFINFGLSTNDSRMSLSATFEQLMRWARSM